MPTPTNQIIELYVEMKIYYSFQVTAESKKNRLTSAVVSLSCKYHVHEW
jgi:hypothetical protein